MSAAQCAEATLLVTSRTLSRGLVRDDSKARSNWYCRLCCPKGSMAISTQTERSVCAAALTAHHPSEGTIVCPCPVGPELRLKVVVRTHPLSTQSPREPGQCWGCCAISTYPSTGSQCTGEQTSSIPEQRGSKVRKTGLHGKRENRFQRLNRKENG